MVTTNVSVRSNISWLIATFLWSFTQHACAVSTLFDSTLIETRDQRLTLSIEAVQDENNVWQPPEVKMNLQRAGCSGTALYRSPNRQTNELVFQERLLPGKCVQNCLLYVARDLSAYREVCKRQSASGRFDEAQDKEELRMWIDDQFKQETVPVTAKTEVAATASRPAQVQVVESSRNRPPLPMNIPAVMPRTVQIQVSDLKKMLDEIVSNSSRSWIMNVYRKGSISEIISMKKGGSTFAKASFLYSDGSEGGVEVEVANGDLKCLGFADTDIRCYPRDPVDSQRRAPGRVLERVPDYEGQANRNQAAEQARWEAFRQRQ